MKRLGDVCELINGRGFKKSEWATTGLPIIRIQNLNGSREFNYVAGPVEEKFRIAGGDLLYAWSATIGPYIWRGPEAALNQHIFKVIPAEEVTREYLYYLLLEATCELRYAMHGSTMTHILKSQLDDLRIELPPLAEQCRIVAEIEKQFTRLDAGNENLAQARRKLSTLSLLAFNTLQPTQSRNGTRRVRLRDVAALIQYGSSAKASAERDGVPVFRMGNISSDGRLLLDHMKYLPADHDEFPALLLEPGDMLFNRTNSAELVGKSAVYHGLPSPCTFASYLIRVRTREECLPEFLAASLNSPYGRKWISSVVTQQVGQANVNGTKLGNFEFSLPALAEQKRLISSFEEIMSVIWNLQNSVTDQLAHTTRLRQAILAKAFSGQLVPQDPNDEPTSVLLERISTERGRAGKAPAKSRRARSRMPEPALQSR